MRAATTPGGARRTARLAALSRIGARVTRLAVDYGLDRRDPVARTRARIDPDIAAKIETRVSDEVNAAARAASARAGLANVGAHR